MKISPMMISLAFALVAASAQAMTLDTVVRDPNPREPAPDAGRKDAKFESFCLQNTGSRIVSGKSGHRCVTAGGRVFTRQDLERTGESDMAAALRKLDPASH